MSARARLASLSRKIRTILKIQPDSHFCGYCEFCAKDLNPNADPGCVATAEASA
jgi:hypothetical protein